jgi:hypothetical protein
MLLLMLVFDGLVPRKHWRLEVEFGFWFCLQSLVHSDGLRGTPETSAVRLLHEKTNDDGAAGFTISFSIDNTLALNELH